MSAVCCMLRMPPVCIAALPAADTAVALTSRCRRLQVRTGCGKSQVSRYIIDELDKLGKKCVLVRHPMVSTWLRWCWQGLRGLELSAPFMPPPSFAGHEGMAGSAQL